jgi:hypothetical protein
MKHWVIAIRLLLAINFLILTSWPLVRSAAAKLNCGPVTNRSSDLPRTKRSAVNSLCASRGFEGTVNVTS